MNVRRILGVRSFVPALIALVVAMMVIVPGVSAQDEAAGPSVLSVHRVDSTNNPVQALALSNDYSTTSASVTENGSAVDARVGTLSSTDLGREVVFVIDSSERLRRNDALLTAQAAIAAEIRSLPSGTRVGVVEAAKTAVLVSPLTEDREAAASAVESMDFSNGSVLYNAIDRAVGLLSEPPEIGRTDTVQTVVVFSGGIDSGSDIELGLARGGLIRRGAQLVTVPFNGGDPAIAALVPVVGGASFPAADAASIGESIDRAATAAGDRYVITYDGVSDPAERGDVVLTLGGADTRFSYQGGELTIRALALEYETELASSSWYGFLESRAAFYAAMLVAFLGIGVIVYTLASVFASGESSLEGMIARYSSGDEELDAEETNIVQTALVQRAVELSETFAEDQGFLVKVEELLERAKLPLRPGEAMSFYSLGILASLAIGFFLFGGIVGGLIFGFVFAIGAIGAVRFMARRRMKKFESQLPDTLQLLAGTLRAGYSLPQGIEAVSHEAEDPMGYELRRVMTEARLGREMEEALGAAAERLNSADFAWAVMAISIQREVGGNLNELLMTVSDTMLARERLKGEVATLTAEGKMSAILLGGLPPALGGVMFVMNPNYIARLFNTFLGNAFLGAGIVASLIGLAWMKKVITIDV